MTANSDHCAFVLLAEFDIYEGAQLKHQYPQPLGVNEGVLAMSMLPDGAETQLDDWTVFFLNQRPFNTVSPAVSTREDEEIEENELLYVLNLVRTKHDKAMSRGGIVRALALCTRHPFIHIFKPLLLLAMDDYFADPSPNCLARLFDAVNAMETSGAPVLTRAEKIIMRGSDRKDVFQEKFGSPLPFASFNQTTNGQDLVTGEGKRKSMAKLTEFDDAFESDIETMAASGDHVTDTGSLIDSIEDTGPSYDGIPSSLLSHPVDILGRSQPLSSWPLRDESDTTSQARSKSLSDSSHTDTDDGSVGSVISLVGGDTLVGEHLSVENSAETKGIATITGHETLGNEKLADDGATPTPTYRHPHTAFPQPELVKTASFHANAPDTHFYHTSIEYNGHQLPIKMPLCSFPEEVGDYSLISLFKLFSSPSLVTGPTHPHLHTNGAQTHPITILFNALITGKRILFIGHKRPAAEVSRFVLAACALGSGCGVVLRGFIQRAFPYANLENRDEWEEVPAYIAGVTNPIFGTSRMWDLLLDIGTGQVVVSNDIFATYPPTPLPPIGGASLVSRSGAIMKTESSIGPEDELTKSLGTSGSKTEFGSKYSFDANIDSLFIEDVRTAIENRYSEDRVRLRFTEYVMRFVRLASRYEEEITGSTKIGYRSSPYHEGTLGRPARLGSGMVFRDEATFMKEIVPNAHRIESWQKTDSYRYCVEGFQRVQVEGPIRGFDVLHQLARLRQAPHMADTEVALIMRTFTDNVRSYEQVVEFLAYLMPGGGGLLHLSFGLFHQKELIREMTVDLFNQLRTYPIGVLFLQGLNCFQRYAYVRQAHALEKRLLAEQHRYQHHLHHQTSHHGRGGAQSSRPSVPPGTASRVSRNVSMRSTSSTGIRIGMHIHASKLSTE